MRPSRWLLISAAVLLAACTAPERTVTSQPPVGASPSAPPPSAQPVDLPEPPASASTLPGALLVRTATFGLQVLAPDGTGLTMLAEGPDVRVVTAAWAPDGDRIAWSQQSLEAGIPASSMVLSDPDGEHRALARLPFAPFYLSWDPTSERVAFLGGRAPFTLGVVERIDGETAGRPLTRGQPFYFSWAPDGEHLLTHVADRRLDTLGVDGQTVSLEERTGVFQAPVWTGDGTSFLYATGDALVAREAVTGRERSLAPMAGAGYWVVSPDGRRVAFHTRGPLEMDFYDRAMPDQATDLGVRVVPVAGDREPRTVTDAPAIAWSWSPDGRRLAIMEPVYDDARVRFRWVVWDGRRTFAGPPFIASLAALQEEVPFFTQFAQSATMWSPDSRAFAYAAQLANGTPAVWIQPATRGADPFPVAAGVAVAWSPV